MAHLNMMSISIFEFQYFEFFIFNISKVRISKCRACHLSSSTSWFFDFRIFKFSFSKFHVHSCHWFGLFVVSFLFVLVVPCWLWLADGCSLCCFLSLVGWCLFPCSLAWLWRLFLFACWVSAFPCWLVGFPCSLVGFGRFSLFACWVSLFVCWFSLLLVGFSLFLFAWFCGPGVALRIGLKLPPYFKHVIPWPTCELSPKQFPKCSKHFVWNRALNLSLKAWGCFRIVSFTDFDDPYHPK